MSHINHDGICQRLIERSQHLVPVQNLSVTQTDTAHGIKYFILNEEPKEYICEQGCVHKYVPPVKPIESLTKTISPTSISRSISSNKPVVLLARRASPILSEYETSQITSASSMRRASLQRRDSPCQTIATAQAEPIPKFLDKIVEPQKQNYKRVPFPQSIENNAVTIIRQPLEKRNSPYYQPVENETLSQHKSDKDRISSSSHPIAKAVASLTDKSLPINKVLEKKTSPCFQPLKMRVSSYTKQLSKKSSPCQIIETHEVASITEPFGKGTSTIVKPLKKTHSPCCLPMAKEVIASSQIHKPTENKSSFYEPVVKEVASLTDPLLTKISLISKSSVSKPSFYRPVLKDLASLTEPIRRQPSLINKPIENKTSSCTKPVPKDSAVHTESVQRKISPPKPLKKKPSPYHRPVEGKTSPNVQPIDKKVYTTNESLKKKPLALYKPIERNLSPPSPPCYPPSRRKIVPCVKPIEKMISVQTETTQRKPWQKPIERKSATLSRELEKKPSQLYQEEKKAKSSTNLTSDSGPVIVTQTEIQKQPSLEKNGSPTSQKEKKYDKNIDVWTRLYPYRSGIPLDPDAIRSPKFKKNRKMDWCNYHRLDVIHAFLDELENTYPSLCTVGVIGQSIEGRELKLLKISNGNANNVAVWMDAGIHAREWIAPAVNTFVANHIARNFDKLPASCTNKDWYFLPVVNPDGYEYSHVKERMWRKNRAWRDGKCVGVDLNRNFSYNWGGRGSSEDPNHHFYRGDYPFSEPESCALRDVLLGAGLPFKVYITLHAFGEVIIFPFAYSDDVCPDYIRLLHGATVMSRAIHNTNGNTYKVGISKDLMYRASGTSNDWCYGVVGIPYCYLIELRSKKHKFKLPQEEIEETGVEILNCVIALMDFVDKYPFFQKSFKVAPPSSAQVWELRLVREGQRNFVKNLDCVGAVNIWTEEATTMDVLVENQRASQVAGMLYEREIPYSIAITDVAAMLEVEKGPGVSRNFRSCKTCARMEWSNYQRLDTINKFMEELATEYPYLCTLYTIGRSFEGRKILMMKISNGNCGNEGVWIDGSIHPREWISTAVVTYIANILVRNFQEQPVSVTNKDWYIVPIVNPDGYEYTHTTDRMWRKNRARYGGGVGVDLNRNFSYGWGENGEEGSSEDPCSIFYRGPVPFSESETEAVKNAITTANTRFRVFLSFHSYGEVIIFPWGFTSNPCPDYVELLEAGTVMARGIFESSGRTYKVGSTKDLMYFASGTSTDWSYGEAKIPYSYMVELRDKKHRFLLPKEEIVDTATEIMNGMLKLLDFVDKRSKGTCACVKP